MSDWGRDPQLAAETQRLGRELSRVAQRPTRRYFAGGGVADDLARTPILARVVQIVAGETAWSHNPNNALYIALRAAVKQLDGRHDSLLHSWKEIAETIFGLGKVPLRDDAGDLLPYKHLLPIALPEGYVNRHRRRFVAEMRERLAEELLRLEVAGGTATEGARDEAGEPVSLDAAEPSSQAPTSLALSQDREDAGEAPTRLTDAQTATSLAADGPIHGPIVPTTRPKRRGKQRGRRLTILALLAVTAVAIGTYAAYDSNRAPEGAPSRTTTSPDPQSRLASLHYKIVGKNNSTHQASWTSNVVAEYTDQLEFEATVTNTSSVEVPSTFLEPFFGDVAQESAPNELQLAAGSLSQVSVLSGTPASVTSQAGSACFGGFTLNSPKFDVLSSDGSISRVLAEVGSYKEVGEYGGMGTLTLGGVAIGPIPAGGAITLQFMVHAWRGSSEKPEFSGGQQVYFAHSGSTDFETIGAAGVNDNLTIGVRLEDTRCDTGGVTGQVRVRITANKAQHSVTVTAYVTAVNFGTQQIGQATVSSTRSAPIGLAVAPHSTQLLAHKAGTSCNASFASVRRLSDGVAEGGVAVGDIKGFQPRLPCGSLDLWRIVEFHASVTDDS